MISSPSAKAPRRRTRWLSLLAACTAPLLAQAQNCPTGINTDDNYILGEADGTASAMHWPTGLVWKRCAEGMGFDSTSGQCTGTAVSKSWHDWANKYLPQAFADQANWGVNAGYSQNLLVSGGWRMPYTKELIAITQDCGDAPTINHSVFPNTPFGYFWSGSPRANNTSYAWSMDFRYRNPCSGFRNDSYRVRLARAGQSFAPLATPAVQAGVAGTAITFPAFTLMPSDSTGQAWGGARISGAGNPEFQINGGSWVQEAIVKSGDAITVRLMAPDTPSASASATFTLRSGQTTGTNADGSNGGAEDTELKETTATFTASALVPVNASCGTASGVATAVAPSADLCTAGTPGLVSSAEGQHSWQCTGQGTGSDASCVAPGIPTASGTDRMTLGITAGAGCQIDSVTAAVPPAGGPAGFDMPYGALDFAVSSCTGDSVTLQATFSGSVDGMSYKKYINNRWINMPASLSANTATFTIADNGPYDADPTTGSIKDPSGPVVFAGGVVATPVPTLSAWALLLMTSLLGLFGYRQLRHKPQ